MVRRGWCSRDSTSFFNVTRGPRADGAGKPSAAQGRSGGAWTVRVAVHISKSVFSARTGADISRGTSTCSIGRRIGSIWGCHRQRGDNASEFSGCEEGCLRATTGSFSRAPHLTFRLIFVQTSIFQLFRQGVRIEPVSHFGSFCPAKPKIKPHNQPPEHHIEHPKHPNTETPQTNTLNPNLRAAFDEFFFVGWGVRCGVFEGVGARRGGGGGPKISRFFFSLPPEISFFLLSLGGLLVELGRCSRAWPTQYVGFGWCRWGRRGFTRQPENSKRAHFRAPALQKPHQNSTKGPPRERRKKENCGGEGKKARNFGPPTLRDPIPEAGPHPSPTILGLGSCFLSRLPIFILSQCCFLCLGVQT